MASKRPLQNLLDLSGAFVVAQKGRWNHADWEAFLKKTEAAGVKLTDEAKRNLGNLLEASKHFYELLPKGAPKKKAAAKKPPAKKAPAKRA